MDKPSHSSADNTDTMVYSCLSGIWLKMTLRKYALKFKLQDYSQCHQLKNHDEEAI